MVRVSVRSVAKRGGRLNRSKTENLNKSKTQNLRKSKTNKRRTVELSDGADSTAGSSSSTANSSFGPPNKKLKAATVSLCRDVGGCSECRRKFGSFPKLRTFLNRDEPLLSRSAPSIDPDVENNNHRKKRRNSNNNNNDKNHYDERKDASGSDEEEAGDNDSGASEVESESDNVVLWDLDTSDANLALFFAPESKGANARDGSDIAERKETSASTTVQSPGSNPNETVGDGEKSAKEFGSAENSPSRIRGEAPASVVGTSGSLSPTAQRADRDTSSPSKAKKTSGKSPSPEAPTVPHSPVKRSAKDVPAAKISPAGKSPTNYAKGSAVTVDVPKLIFRFGASTSGRNAPAPASYGDAPKNAGDSVGNSGPGAEFARDSSAKAPRANETAAAGLTAAERMTSTACPSTSAAGSSTKENGGTGETSDSKEANSSAVTRNYGRSLPSKPTLTKLWSCVDCNYRTNIRHALHEHRKCHVAQQLKDMRRSKARSKRVKAVNCQFEVTNGDAVDFARNNGGKVSSQSRSPSGAAAAVAAAAATAAESVKYQCQECKTSSTRWRKILHYQGHRRGHRMFVLCPHCEYLIDFTATALIRMKNHCLSSHIKMNCRRCRNHVFKGHQAGNVLSHLESHLEEDEKALQVGTLQGGRRQKCLHCRRFIYSSVLGDHLKQHVIEDWSAVQEYFKRQLEKIGLEAPEAPSDVSKPQSKTTGAQSREPVGRPAATSSGPKENSDAETPSFASLASIHGVGGKSPAVEKWKCENCEFETDAPEIYMQHLVDNHNPKSLSMRARQRNSAADQRRKKAREFEATPKLRKGAASNDPKDRVVYAKFPSSLNLKEERKSVPIVEIALDVEEDADSVVNGEEKGREDRDPSGTSSEATNDVPEQTAPSEINKTELDNPKEFSIERDSKQSPVVGPDSTIPNDEPYSPNEISPSAAKLHDAEPPNVVTSSNETADNDQSSAGLDAKDAEATDGSPANAVENTHDSRLKHPGPPDTDRDTVEPVHAGGANCPTSFPEASNGVRKGSTEPVRSNSGSAALENGTIGASHERDPDSTKADEFASVSHPPASSSSNVAVTESTLISRASSEACDNSPFSRYRAHYENLEQMSPIEILGLFRRFVSALIVYKGCCPSPLIDWEDKALRPNFYPPWLPWLDPDAKPLGFEDSVWTALLKEGLKFMFENERP